MIIKSLELHNFRQFMDDEDGHGQKNYLLNGSGKEGKPF